MRTAIKSQALTEFLADWTPKDEGQEEVPLDPVWIIYCDETWGASGASTTTVVSSPSGIKLQYADRLHFQTTNNVEEYEAVLLGLREAKALSARWVLVKTNSSVVVCQIDKTFQAREPELTKYMVVV